MPKTNKVNVENQSRSDHAKEAKNASNGFKFGASSGTHGVGDNFRNK